MLHLKNRFIAFSLRASCYAPLLWSAGASKKEKGVGVGLSPHPVPFLLGHPIHQVGYRLGKRSSCLASVKNRRVCLVLETQNARHF